MLGKLKQLIHDDEGLAVEFRCCENELANSVYETVAVFSNRRASIRAKIARDLVSNSLVHREYTSAYPVIIVIEHSRIVTAPR